MMVVEKLLTLRSNFRMASFSPLQSQNISFSNVEDDGTTGYDYDFVPLLDNKYMCPICLNALRDPVQTECGHRFCHLCIVRCIRNTPRCPVDQKPLSTSQLFLDRSAQREVLDLEVRCKNKQCDAIIELRNIQNHEEDCKQQPVECPHCKHTVKRYRLKQHISGECPQAPIHCVFDKVGCHRTYSRHEIQNHMETSTQIHLQYLLGTVAALQKQNKALEENLREAKEKLDEIEVSKIKSKLDKLWAADDEDQDSDDNLSTMTNSPDIYNCNTEIHNFQSGSNVNEIDEIALIKRRNRLETSESAGFSSSTSSCSSPGAMVFSTPGSVNGLDSSCNAVDSVRVLENKHKDHDQKIVGLDHHVRELTAKMDNQTALMKEINNKLSAFELKMEEFELRCCNGLYYWRIRDYPKLRKAASLGDMPVLHSPGFYTSPQGYKMCIRANLDGVDKAQGTHLSLFVHIMKGEYDDLLSWPFHGSITLTVINQRELPSQRAHVSETLEARSNLMAFHRPVTERNQKGYGYIDFFPLKPLETEGFIKANTLVIKAQVKVFENAYK